MNIHGWEIMLHTEFIIPRNKNHTQQIEQLEEAILFTRFIHELFKTLRKE